jgi:hypothetical protein
MSHYESYTFEWFNIFKSLMSTFPSDCPGCLSEFAILLPAERVEERVAHVVSPETYSTELLLA